MARIERDAHAFLARDIPALIAWEYSREKADMVSAPVLFVGGSDTGAPFRQTPAWASSLFPHLTAVTIPGAGHDLALTHTRELAAEMARFLAGQTSDGAD